ncbi:MAG: ADP-ribosylglycohydrolase family protein [Candidatus Eremiobacteraeota bacterium]|nr:ADP-ribosylglycohydrolase family protein [Candidatus Eremiobacteraeota bacterium]MCW5871186.1 ADP-ribosylglycohydrolase family protein [Candidatus Eremiobacteraeota bacterium]
MLIFLAIGDAYGAGFEYARADFVVRHNDLKRYYQHPEHLGIRPGMYTDDTQMSLAVAEALLDHSRPTPLHWAEHFVRAFRREPRHGYAQRFYDFLLTVKDGKDFLARIKPHSAKSGAAMRALPVGYLATPQLVLEVAAEQARLTHDTPGGIRSAQGVALSAHFLLRGGPKAGLPAYLEKQLGGGWFDWRGSVGSAGMDSARAALTSFHRHPSMQAMLKECIAWTGDVDTVAALALGLAGCAPEVECDLPEVLLQDLENGPFGSDYIKQLDQRLRDRFLGAVT